MSFLSRLVGKGGRPPDPGPAKDTQHAYNRHTLKADYRAIAASGLFDVPFYTVRNPDFTGSGLDPIEHYLMVGTRRGADPHPCFSTTYYLQAHGAPDPDSGNPFAHYLNTGTVRGANPHPLFDSVYYLGQFPELSSTSTSLLAHYLKQGALSGARPNPLFHSDYYLQTYDDVRASGINPLVHFLLVGAAEGRNPSAAFDTAYYVSSTPDAAGSGLDPLSHYLLVGRQEGRRSSPLFQPDVDARVLVLMKQLRAEAETATLIVSDERSPDQILTLLPRPGANTRPTAHFVLTGPGRAGHIGLWHLSHPDDLRLEFQFTDGGEIVFSALEMLAIDDLLVLFRMGEPFRLRALVERLRLPYVLWAGLEGRADGAGAGANPSAEADAGGNGERPGWRLDYDWLVAGADRLIG